MKNSILYKLYYLVFAICFILVGFPIGIAQNITPENCPPDTVIEIPDKQEFYPRLVYQFNKSQGDSITCGDMQSLTIFGAMTGGVLNLTGIEYAINIESVGFTKVGVNNLEPLQNLTKLKAISISIDGIPISGGFSCDGGSGSGFDKGREVLSTLVNLENLTIQAKGIKDLSFLKELKNLKTLNLRCNNIEDLSSLVNLSNLESLVLGGNQISDITPLTNLKKLKTLHLDRNCLEDLTPLQNLTNLEHLTLSANQYSQKYCYLNSFQSISKLKNLETITISGTNFDDVSLLLNSPKLKYVSLSRNMITDIRPLIGVLTTVASNLEDNRQTTIDVRGNNIDANSLIGFSEELPNFKPNSLTLRLAYNCFNISQLEVSDTFSSKGLLLDHENIEYILQKPKCDLMVVFPWKSPPRFFNPISGEQFIPQ